MITEYYRPKTIDGALALINRVQPKTIPLGGGSGINKAGTEDVAVVDLQDLRLDGFQKNGSAFVIGATTRLQSLVEWEEFPAELRVIITRQYPINLRNSATLAGSLVCTHSKSDFSAALLALDAKLTWAPGEREIPFGDWLPLRGKWAEGKIITEIRVNWPAHFGYEAVRRTPMDQPLVGVAVSRWASGRTRLVLVGVGSAPICVFDGTEVAGIKEAANNACSHYINKDNIEYYSKMIQVLIHRLIGEA